jgi:MFS family permease
MIASPKAPPSKRTPVKPLSRVPRRTSRQAIPLQEESAAVFGINIVEETEEVSADDDDESRPGKGGQPDETRRGRSKIFSFIDGSMNAISVGFSGNFISAFGIALGASNAIIAMLSSLPQLIAAVVQLGVQRIRRFFPSRKRYLAFFAFLQALMWLPMLLVPALHHPGLWLLAFVTLNTVFGMLTGPVWNSYMGDLVEESERGRFFGRRNMVTGLSAFIATLFAGWILHAVPPANKLFGFGILFVMAFAFRAMSAYFLSKMANIQDTGLGTKEPDIEEFVRTAEQSPLGKFTIFLVLFYVAVYLSAPFFAVYQLSILRFDYLTFTLIASASAIASFLAMLVWGKYVDGIGSKNVLVTCGFLIPFVPFFWTLTTDPWLLGIAEAFSGIAWAGFNLSMSTYLFDATDRKERTRQVAEYTLFIQLAVFIGAMLGSAMLGMFDRTDPSAYLTIFWVSAALRLAVVVIFFKSLQELRVIEVPVRGRLFRRFISIVPHHGIIYAPALETKRVAGRFATETPKAVGQDMAEYARKMNGGTKRSGSESPIKRIEREEDEQDLQMYMKKLRWKK